MACKEHKEERSHKNLSAATDVGMTKSSKQTSLHPFDFVRNLFHLHMLRTHAVENSFVNLPVFDLAQVLAREILLQPTHALYTSLTLTKNRAAG